MEANHLTRHLPFLRRYSRALTGSADCGDDLLMEGLQAAFLAPVNVDGSGRSRLWLYALLNRLFDAKENKVPAPSPLPIERALGRLPESLRRLYLLSTLEELSLTDTARVLGLTPSAAATGLRRAREALRRQLMARVLLVEDNAIVADDLRDLVTGMGHEVCGLAATEADVFSLVESRRPTLAVMDVRLSDGGSGIDIARKLRKTRGVPVIFVTAHDGDLAERGLQHLGFVVRKPFSAEALRAAVTRAVFMPRPVACAA
jgi:DNA-directed RNA polymerase specialized sigma24 family protein/CheY-like chemotaxis protein